MQNLFLFFTKCFIFVNVIKVAEGCSCVPEPLSQHDTWCMADWISVAKIVHKSKGEMTSYLSIGPIRLPQIKYTVEHQQIFKGNKTLPKEIFTGPDDAACGVTWLRENHTYLLVGSMMFCFRDVDQHDKILTINYCFGLPLRDGAYGTITEWENIPESLATKLHNEDFGICTNKKR